MLFANTEKMTFTIEKVLEVKKYWSEYIYIYIYIYIYERILYRMFSRKFLSAG